MSEPAGQARREAVRDALKLYWVMGTPNCEGTEPEALLTEAIEGGITMFQFREKGPGALEGDERNKLGAKLRELCRDAGIPFIVNDDPDLAVSLDADGVHIGQEDRSASEVRERIGPNRWLGISAHNVEEAEEAVRQGADYLGVGPMYPTVTKPDARPVQGSAMMGQIRAALPAIPLVGIGGIQEIGVIPVIAAGADGVAVVSAIAGAKDPKQKAELLLRRVEEFQG